MKYSSIPLAQLVVEHCRLKGIKNVVISPGSRNAPLTIGFTENPYFKCYSIVDERSAAFFALGIAQQLRKPVAIVCTSGSALLNYYPAIAEAFYSIIPLLVLSADRPSYRIDIGDGQTIRQDNVFHKHIGYSVTLKQDIVHATDSIKQFAPHLILDGAEEATQKAINAHNDTELHKAIDIAINKCLPVHINIPFEEPLYDILNEPKVTVKDRNDEAVLFNDDPKEIKKCIDIWSASTRKMVLVGVNAPNTVSQEFLDILGNDPSVIVFTETTSNIHHPNFFNSIDSIVAPIEKLDIKEELFLKLQPDILLTFGGLIVSKKIKTFLRNYKPKYHYHIDSLKAYDTFYVLSHHFKMEVNLFFEKFLRGNNPVASNYFLYWHAIKRRYELKRKEYITKIAFSDLLAFYIISKYLPEDYQLQLSNSSTVRYMQLFDVKPSLRVFCNRGTSGIDGSTSTAIGASIYDKTPTLLITGDLSFLYDSNGLWNAYIRPDFRIIVVNNNGGGIFRILPGQEETENFETYFETVQNLDLSSLCILYGLDYQVANTPESLEVIFKDFFSSSSSPKLLEIQTPRTLNSEILVSYFNFLADNLKDFNK